MPMFRPGQVEEIEPSEIWSSPCRLQVGGDRVERSLRLGMPHLVELGIPREALTERAAGALASRLVDMVGAWPAGVEPTADAWSVEVPLMEPERMSHTVAVWRITPELTLTHQESGSAWLRLANGAASVGLDGPQCWALLRALLSLRAWQSRLNAAFRLTAVRCRAEALGGTVPGEPPAVFAGATSRRIALNDALALPCRAVVRQTGCETESLPGDEQVLELELSWLTTSPYERGLLAVLLSRLGAALPSAWRTEDGFVEVPYVHPTGGGESELIWRFADGIDVVYSERGCIYFRRVGDEWDGREVGSTFRRRFDVHAIRWLIQVTASVNAWEEELADVFEAAAKTHRTERLATARAARSAQPGG